MEAWGTGLVATFLLGGCFTYVPRELESVPLGEDVRVTLTQEGASSLRSWSQATLHRDLGSVVHGALLRLEGEHLVIRVSEADWQGGFHRTEFGQDIRIPMGDVLVLEERELERVRTGLVVAAAAGGVFGVMHMILSDARPPRDGPPPPEPDVRAPWLHGHPY